MTLESWRYGDPETVAIRTQEIERIKDQACGNCEHRIVVQFKNEMVKRCEFKRKTYGDKCELFKKRK